MSKTESRRGEHPASLENLNKPLPSGYETAVFRVSAPAHVIAWFRMKGKDDGAAVRGRILTAAKQADIDGSEAREEYGD